MKLIFHSTDKSPSQENDVWTQMFKEIQAILARFQRKITNPTSESAPHHEKSTKNQEFRLNFANFFDFFAKFHDFSLEISSAPSNLASYNAPRISPKNGPLN